MANLQVKRGTNAQRLTITPVVGELIYTTDTKTLYIGDGTTVGGVITNADILVDGAEAQSLIFSDPLDSSTTSGVSTVSIVPATPSVPGSMSAADKTKLDIVPNAIGTATQVLQVNAGATALEYITPASGSSAPQLLFRVNGSGLSSGAFTNITFASSTSAITDGRYSFNVANQVVTVNTGARYKFELHGLLFSGFSTATAILRIVKNGSTTILQNSLDSTTTQTPATLFFVDTASANDTYEFTLIGGASSNNISFGSVELLITSLS